ncbi:5'-3' exoribonuclease 2 homolog [Macrobrachium nipponense]|uniref:5'-3' exoribonuclease 2 homolog n=1 Tax=Macrobrachium nipponense TaxID=159736 RepID=UPI0030C8757C
MGVPAFFRWLSRKYPSVIIDCVEDTQFKTEDGSRVPVDALKPNPNGVEFDNLYLDMNGIIHPCTHPEDKPAPKNEDEMMVAIFECIDRLFSIVRPRKLLYMAIDGVAPRAKMNQQRSRRFRASKEAYEKKLEVARLRQELQEKGYKIPPEKPKESHFDSNCITPGTPFMDRLSKCLHYYVHERLNTDPAWRNIKIVLSDANVPGEGEHKIMDYIRRQRAQPDHDPDTHHVLCGADADLIMLGLATHELNFTIIREEFKPNKPKPCDICGQLGHEMVDCLGLDGDSAGDEPEKVYEEQKYIFVRLNVLREYLERELAMPNLPFKYDFDRAIDDWVFMCFFVGNDFLPHLPSLEIRENAIDRLVNLYKDCCYKTGGWLTDSGSANMRRVQMILQNLGKVEDQIFKTRQKKELEFRARDRAQKRQQKMEKEAAYRFLNQTGQGALGVMKAGDTAVAHGAKGSIMQQRLGNMGGRGIKRGHSDVDDEEEEEVNHDEVRLYEDGFKDRYYESKFEVTAENLEFRRRVADEYARGLCWVLKYYYQGCVSWNWYFPYHYAPFASDFVNCANANVNFDKGEPFNPLEQLMGVFPAASRSHVPEPWGELMIRADSNIIDFYPEDFKIDLNGKKFAWQGVALLPFVDEVRLKRALEEVYPLLSDEEIRRNKRGDARMYVSCKHAAYTQLCDMYRMGMNFDTEVPISGDEYQGVQGKVLLAGDIVEPNGVLQAPVQGLPPVRDNQVVTVRFRDPSYPEGFVFPARKLENAEPPPRVLKGDNVGSGPPGSYRPQIGFSRNLPQASLGGAGHRALGHLLPNAQEEGSDETPPFFRIQPSRNLFDDHPTKNSAGDEDHTDIEGTGEELVPEEESSDNVPSTEEASAQNDSSGDPHIDNLPLQRNTKGGTGLLPNPVIGSLNNKSLTPNRTIVTPNLLAGGLNNEKLPLLKGERGGKGLLGAAPTGSGLLPTPDISFPSPFTSFGQTSQEGVVNSLGLIGALIGSGLRGQGEMQSSNQGNQGESTGSSNVEDSRNDYIYPDYNSQQNSFLPPIRGGSQPYRNGRGRSRMGCQSRNFQDNSVQQDGLLGACPLDYGGWNEQGSGFHTQDFPPGSSQRGGMKGMDYTKNSNRRDDYKDDSLLGHGPQRSPGRPGFEGKGLLGEGPGYFYGSYNQRGGMFEEGYDSHTDYEEGSYGNFYESEMGPGGLLGISPDMSHHVNRGRGGGQYSNVPPPSGMSGSRGGRGGGTSLLGAPPGNFQMMNQSANYQGYGGGGGQGGRFNQNKHHGGGGGYNSSKQGGGYNNSQWQSQVSRGGGNSSYNSRGGGNGYGSRGGGGGGYNRGNKRGRGSGGSYFSSGSGY